MAAASCRGSSNVIASHVFCRLDRDSSAAEPVAYIVQALHTVVVGGVALYAVNPFLLVK